MAVLLELQHALRALLKTRSLTAMAVVTMALSIGAATAIFSVVQTVLLRPLGFRAPAELVAIWQASPQTSVVRKPTSCPNFADWRRQSHSFAAMTAFATFTMTVTEPEPDRLLAGAVSQGFFPVLGVDAARGRLFSPDEHRPGHDGVAVISSAAWQRRFGGDPSIVGRRIKAANSTYTVIGILPSWYRAPGLEPSEQPPEIWVPADFNNDIRAMDFLTVIARLKPGVPLTEARAEMTTINQRMAAQYADDRGFEIRTLPVADVMFGHVRRPLWLLFGAVVLLLVSGCVNVANLLLARSIDRRREFAIRAALGSPRAALFRQGIMEGLLLSAAGGLLGILLAKLALDWLLATGGSLIPRADQVHLDAPVLLFALALACLTGIVFGCVPVWVASTANLGEALKASGRALAGTAVYSRLRALLVASEVSLALVLLIGAGLLLRSFGRVLGIELGFSSRNVLTAEVRLPSRRANDELTMNFLHEVLDRIAVLPGVEAVGAGGAVPLAFDRAPGLPFRIEGRPELRSGEPQEALLTAATPGYFRALRVPLRRGRLFEDRDARGSRTVALINEALARRFFPGEDPIGKHLTLDGPAEVIGIVGDVRQSDLMGEPRPQIYTPHSQRSFPTMSLIIRTSGDPAKLVGAVRRELSAMDKTVPLSNIATAADLYSNALVQRRFTTWLIAALAALALILTAGGTYSVISCSVAQRTREIGIRMALGATRAGVLALIVREGLLMTARGLAVGLPLALAGTRLLSSLLYGVTPTDSLTFGLVVLLFIAVTVVASYIPARQATVVNAVVALRAD